MKSSDDELDDFQHRNKKPDIQRSVSASNSTSISNSFLDKYSEREDKKPKPGCSTNSIKVGIYILFSMKQLPILNELKHLVCNEPIFTYLDLRKVERRNFCQNNSATT